MDGFPPAKDEVAITLRGEPTAWARAGRSGKFTFTPKKQRNAMAEIKFAGGQAMGNRAPFEGALSVTLTFTYGWLGKHGKKLREECPMLWKSTRPDADNLTKLIGDALNEVVWRDDAQIAHLIVRKVFAEIPSIQIHVRAI